MIIPAFSDACKIIAMPRYVNVRGRQISPNMLISSSLAEPLVYWLSTSIAGRLLGDEATWGNLIADPEHLMGMRWSPSVNVTEKAMIEEHGAATKLLIISESISQIMAPAINQPEFDYANLLINFRDNVDYHFKAGQKVSVNQLDLHKVLYNELHSSAWRMTSNIKQEQTKK